MNNSAVQHAAPPQPTAVNDLNQRLNALNKQAETQAASEN